MTDRMETQVKNSLAIGETIRVSVERAAPSGGWAQPEDVQGHDLIVNPGRIYIAQRISGGDTVASAMAHIAVGTVSTAAALTNSTVPGEVARKATAINSATTDNVWTAVATFGGNADSVTSLSLVEAGVFNHAASGNGTMMQRVTFASVVLADSDILSLTLETNVGSNTI